MEFTIRVATLDDLPAICALSQELFEYEKQFTDEFAMDWSLSENGKSFFTKRIRGRSSFILLAEMENKVIGYAVIFIERQMFRAYNRIAELENLCVAPKNRGQGVGSALIVAAKEKSRQMGAKRLKVFMLSQNEKAIHFYRTQGFFDFDLVMEIKLE